jgi:acyl-CoA reductase-like NAD-dependent aldehyde dehydrogenase
MMTTKTVTIHNVETGEIITREMNAEELAQDAADKAAYQAFKETEEKAAADKAALLAKLGITADEAKLLLS